MKCPNCACETDYEQAECSWCGGVLHPEEGFTFDDDDDEEEAVSPANKDATIAFTFGLFCFIPFFGIFASAGAIIYGLRGLKFSKKNPLSGGMNRCRFALFAGFVVCPVNLVVSLIALPDIRFHFIDTWF